MPEYLAPAVYVEEIDTGNKPIEGVSTSTAGMIGVTERGPANVPILMTSYGEYMRWFGERLNRADFGDYCYLPHAVEGFFVNGGKRVFIARVLDPAAAVAAERQLVAPVPAAPTATQLIRRAASGDSTVTVVDGTGLAPTDMIQIGDGTGVEFRTISAPLVAANIIAIDLPLGFNHAAAVPNSVEPIPAPADAISPNDFSSNLVTGATSGATTLTLATTVAPTPIATGDLLRVGTAGSDEYVFVSGPPVGNSVLLSSSLQLPHASGTQVVRQSSPAAGPATQLVVASSPGDVVLELLSTAGFANFVRFLDANPTRVEIRRIGELGRITLTQGAYTNYPVGSRVERVTLGAVSPPIDLTANADIGATVVRVSDRSLLSIGDLLQIGLGADLELAEIAALPAPGPNPNPGNVVLRAGLRRHHDANPGVVAHIAAPSAITLSTVLATDTEPNVTSLVVANDKTMAATEHLRITPPVGGPFYHEIAAAPSALAPQTVTLNLPLTRSQTASAPVVIRTPMILVRALDAGSWGNRLRVAMETQTDALLMTTVRQVVGATSLRLQSAVGVEGGSELIVSDATNTDTPVKVQSIDRQNDYLITLEASTSLPGLVTTGDKVRSREYRFVVELLRQQDPGNPSRNNQVVDREVFVNLSLDFRHSRYFQSVIGCTWDMANPTVTVDDTVPVGRPLRLADRRSEGESNYVRVRDLAPVTGFRLAPTVSYEIRPDGTPRLILLPLANGDDALGAVSDTTYIGNDNVQPELRTGLFTLRNIEEISIVTVPGRTSVAMQAALINHCEFMRYRFAVLDGSPPPQDSLANIQMQRQQFDTKYAALYYPWLLIPDPYPANPSAPPDYPIPPSGHMIGVYARTDIERGVHKAPANEVVRGVIGLQRKLNKEQHDILNPYPVNINVIRDFRDNNRGIRVYGGRVITSDSDWKYVNVRRLLIFIEASIDRGLQWVVFEPNAEPLWARVRRSISNFLTLVWRNGGLEGTKVEEAYFVKCDRTTMTQTDIDSGRLICVVGVAPVKPAEFVIVRIGLWTAHADD